MVCVNEGRKKFQDMFSRIDRIPECNGRTDRLVYGCASCHGIVCAMYTCRAVKNKTIGLMILPSDGFVPGGGLMSGGLCPLL